MELNKYRVTLTYEIEVEARNEDDAREEAQYNLEPGCLVNDEVEEIQ